MTIRDDKNDKRTRETRIPATTKDGRRRETTAPSKSAVSKRVRFTADETRVDSESEKKKMSTPTSAIPTVKRDTDTDADTDTNSAFLACLSTDIDLLHYLGLAGEAKKGPGAVEQKAVPVEDGKKKKKKVHGTMSLTTSRRSSTVVPSKVSLGQPSALGVGIALSEAETLCGAAQGDDASLGTALRTRFHDDFKAAGIEMQMHPDDCEYLLACVALSDWGTSKVCAISFVALLLLPFPIARVRSGVPPLLMRAVCVCVCVCVCAAVQSCCLHDRVGYRIGVWTKSPRASSARPCDRPVYRSQRSIPYGRNTTLRHLDRTRAPVVDHTPHGRRVCRRLESHRGAVFSVGHDAKGGGSCETCGDDAQLPV